MPYLCSYLNNLTLSPPSLISPYLHVHRWFKRGKQYLMRTNTKLSLCRYIVHVFSMLVAIKLQVLSNNWVSIQGLREKGSKYKTFSFNHYKTSKKDLLVGFL